MVTLEGKDIIELAKLCVHRMANVECPTLMTLMVDVLLRAQKERGFDINAADGYGLTPLMNVASEGFRDLTKRLIDAGADPSIAEGNGQTALSFAKAHQKRSEPYREIVALLESWGAATTNVMTLKKEEPTPVFQLAAASPTSLQMH